MDRGYANEAELKQALETLLGARVMRIEVVALDMVRDLTIADVRYKAFSTKRAGKSRHTLAADQQDSVGSLIAAPHPGTAPHSDNAPAYPPAPVEASYNYSGTRS